MVIKVHPPRQIMTRMSQWYINLRNGKRLQICFNVFETDMHGLSEYEYGNLGYRTAVMETYVGHAVGNYHSSANVNALICFGMVVGI